MKKKTIIDGKDVNQLRINQKRTIENIRKIREERKITQYRLAKDLHLSRTTYCGIENGKISISFKYVNRLADYYGVPIDDLIVYEEDYNKGFYDALDALMEYINKGYLGLKTMIFDFKSDCEGTKYNSFLYPFLYSLGYEISVEKSSEASVGYGFSGGKSSEKIREILPDELEECAFDEEYTFLIVKEGRKYCYCSPKEFKKFERIIKGNIHAYFAEFLKRFEDNASHVPYGKYTKLHHETDPFDTLKKQLSDIRDFAKRCEEIMANATMMRVINGPERDENIAWEYELSYRDAADVLDDYIINNYLADNVYNKAEEK